MASDEAESDRGLRVRVHVPLGGGHCRLARESSAIFVMTLDVRGSSQARLQTAQRGREAAAAFGGVDALIMSCVLHWNILKALIGYSLDFLLLPLLSKVQLPFAMSGLTSLAYLRW